MSFAKYYLINQNYSHPCHGTKRTRRRASFYVVPVRTCRSAIYVSRSRYKAELPEIYSVLFIYTVPDIASGMPPILRHGGELPDEQYLCILSFRGFLLFTHIFHHLATSENLSILFLIKYQNSEESTQNSWQPLQCLDAIIKVLVNIAGNLIFSSFTVFFNKQFKYPSVFKCSWHSNFMEYWLILIV